MAGFLQRERITRYIQDVYGTEAEYLWADSPDSQITPLLKLSYDSVAPKGRKKASSAG